MTLVTGSLGIISEALDSALHLVAAGGTYWLSIVQADAIGAIGVAGIVTYVSIQLGRRAVANIIDEVSPALVLKIAQAARVAEVMNVTDVRARHSGPETFVDLTVEMPRDISVDAAHQVTEQVEKSIQELVPNCSIIVQVDPCNHAICTQQSD